MVNIFLDSNILLYFLAGDSDPIKFFTEFNPSISFIVELEILSAPNLIDLDKGHVLDLLHNITVINYSADLKDLVIDIRSKKKVKLPDDIVADTSIYYNMPLLSAYKGFEKVDRLELIRYKPKF